MISIIVPVYNIEKYIERCILSILAQTYTDFELLLINDGSTDSSLEICNKWEQKDQRIRLFSQKNSGVSSARNLGLDVALGEYICFIDGDDWIAPDCLEKMIIHMTENVDVIVCEHQKITENGVLIDKPSEKLNFFGKRSQSEALHDIYHNQFYPRIIWGKLYRKELWQNIRFKHFAYTEDTLAMFEILNQIQSLYIISDPLYFYFQRNDSVSHQLNLSHCEDALATCAFMYQTALEQYPNFLPRAAQSFLACGHYALVQYDMAGKKEKGVELIERMQQVYQSSPVKSTAFADRLLIFPKWVLCLWVKLKVRLIQK